jgi:hypothetical protein
MGIRIIAESFSSRRQCRSNANASPSTIRSVVNSPHPQITPACPGEILIFSIGSNCSL